MQLKHLDWSCVLLALSGCPSKLDGPCGGFTCTETERCESDTLTCVPDEPPEISIIVPGTVVSTSRFAISGIIKDDEAITLADWQTDSSGWVALTLDEEGAFSIMVDAPMLDSESVVITFRARDVRTQTTKDVSVQVDRVAPSLRLLSPDAGSLVGGASVEVAVEAVDGSETIGALTIDGQPVSMPQSGVAALQMIAVPDTHNGDALNFEVIAADAYGNRTAQNFSFVGDRVGPQVTFEAPAANQWITTPTFMVEVDVADPSPIASVNVTFEGTAYPATESTPGHWTASVMTTIEEQDEVITVEATDVAGNASTQTRTVRIDRVAPTVTIVSPTAGSVHRMDFLPVSVTSSPDTSSVSMVMEGPPVALTGGPTSWSGSVEIPGRDYSSSMVTATATDAAGNSATTSVSVMIDQSPPRIVFTTVTNGQRFNASDFTTTQNVVVSWSLIDADPQATTTMVNGVSTSALTTSVPTSPTDNPQTYTTVVTAVDRSGNTRTNTVIWSVDRVVPTVVSWTPASNARNVEPWESVITFSEPVQNVRPLVNGQVQFANSDTTRTVFTAPLSAFKSQVIDVALNNVMDEYGNRVAAATRRFHLATGFANSTTTVATGVSQFDVSSDSDGVMSVAVLTTTNQLRVYEDTGGQFTEVAVTQPSPAPTGIWVNSFNVVNGTTLQSSRRVGLTAGSTQWWRYQILDGVQSGTPDQVPFGGAVVSRPPLPNEPSTTMFGTIEGSSYARGPMVRILSNDARGVVAQSNDSFAAHTSSSSQVLWSHYRCRNTVVGPQCESIGYGASATSANRLQAAMTPSGGCLATTWTSGTTRQGVFQSLSPCDFTACFGNTSMALSGSIPADLRVAPYGANGENTLLFSYASSGIELTVSKMSQACGAGGSTAVGTMPLPSAHQPVRVGNRPGVLYLTGTTLNLRVF